LEVGNLKKRFGDDLLGVTPARAIKDGSDYLVIGRPIRDADDPAQAVARITAEIESGLATA